jgi:hypothetical protein
MVPGSPVLERVGGTDREAPTQRAPGSPIRGRRGSRGHRSEGVGVTQSEGADSEGSGVARSEGVGLDGVRWRGRSGGGSGLAWRQWLARAKRQ